MIIEKYGVRLERLTVNELEIVREKRNSEKIRSNMVFQEQISKEEQIKWFHSIDNVNNIYLVVHYEGEKIGLINGKNTDFENRVSEGGIFIWEERRLQSVIPALCSIIMHDYNFLICEFEKTIIKVLKTNVNAIQFNKSFGYEPVSEESNEQNYQTFQLTRENYLQKIAKYRKAVGVHTGDMEELGENNFSFCNTADADILRLYGPLPKYLVEKVNLILKKENRTLLPE
jgi:hypothetical protein